MSTTDVPAGVLPEHGGAHLGIGHNPAEHGRRGQPCPGHDRFEVNGLRLLAAGRADEVIALVAASGRRDHVADLLVADARTRQLDIEVSEVQALVERIVTTGGAPLRLRAWAQATLAERLISDGEVASLVIARQMLDELAGMEPQLLPPVALRYAHARLLRVQAGSWLMVPAPDGIAEHIAQRDLAISELISCGFVDEVHVTRGGSAGLLSTVLFEDIHENHDRLVDARAALDDNPESMWCPMLDYFLSISSFETGDLTGALRAYERIERAPYQQRRIALLPRYGRAFLRLITAGASNATIEGIESSLADVRRHDPRMAQNWHGYTAHTLADMGSRTAVYFARLEADLPALDIMGRADRRVLALRTAALEGRPPSSDEVLDTVTTIAGFGHGRRAARTAVRIAQDLARAGDQDGARVVRDWGIDRLPPRARRTVWEQWWCRQLESGPEAFPGLGAVSSEGRTRVTTGARGIEIRVLSPTVEVELNGRPVVLSDNQARLVLALVIAYPAPLHVERVSDLLWPDEDLASTRSRLNSLVHRLRRVLGRDGDVVDRSGDVLSLDGARCRVDLWGFQRALAGEPEDRRQALAAVRGNLGDTQFPYEEAFVDERHRFTGDWLRHACRAHRAGEVTAAELTLSLSALGLGPEDLDVPSAR